jgi:hypothetical protein
MTRGQLLSATLLRKAVLRRCTAGRRRGTVRKHACDSREQSGVLGARYELRRQGIETLFDSEALMPIARTRAVERRPTN